MSLDRLTGWQHALYWRKRAEAADAQVAAVRALAENARKHAGGSYTAQVDALSIERALSSTEEGS